MPPIPPSLLPKSQITNVQVTKPTWQERSTIFREQSGRIRVVNGWVYGTLAVHGTQDGDIKLGSAPITVTHRPSLVAIIRVEETDDAVACAERLWDTCREALYKPGENADVSKIPPDVVDWIKRCNKERKLVE